MADSGVLAAATRLVNGLRGTALGAAVSAADRVSQDAGKSLAYHAFGMTDEGNGYEPLRSLNALEVFGEAAVHTADVRFAQIDGRAKLYHSELDRLYKGVMNLKTHNGRLLGDTGPVIRHPIQIRVTIPVSTSLIKHRPVKKPRVNIAMPPKLSRLISTTFGKAPPAPAEPVLAAAAGGVWGDDSDTEEERDETTSEVSITTTSSDQSSENCMTDCASVVTFTEGLRRSMSRALGLKTVVVIDFIYDHKMYTEIVQAMQPTLAARGETPGNFLARVRTGVTRHLTAAGSGNNDHCEYMTLMSQIIAATFVCDCDANAQFLVITHHLEEVYVPFEIPAPAPDPTLAETFDTLKSYYGDSNAIYPCPALEMSGTPYTDADVVIEVIEEAVTDHWFKEVNRSEAPVPLAVLCGPNIFGAMPPVDTKHPLSFASGMTRHMNVADKAVSTLEEGKVVVNIAIDKRNISKPSQRYYQICDYFNDHMEIAMRNYLEAEDVGPADVEALNPHSLSETEVDDCLQEHWDEVCKLLPPETSNRSKIVTAVHSLIFIKSNENSTRARFISEPGKSKPEARKHQVFTSRACKLLEKALTWHTNHTSIKGLTPEGIRRQIALIMDPLDLPDWVVQCFDKSANDRTWSAYDYEEFIDTVQRMVNVYFEVQGEVPGYSPMVWENFANATTLDVKIACVYMKLTLSFTVFYLLSGVGPTSTCNRLRSAKDAAILIDEIYGRQSSEVFIRQYFNGELADGCWNGLFKDGIPKLRWPTPLRISDMPGYFVPKDDRQEQLLRAEYKKYLASLKVLNKAAEWDRHHMVAVGVMEGDDQGFVMQIPHKIASHCKTQDLGIEKAIGMLNRRLIELGASQCHIILTNPDGIESKHCHGPNAVFDFTSRHFMRDEDTVQPSTIMVPLPVKNIQKFAWAKAFSLRARKLENGVTVYDFTEDTYRYLATRALSILEWQTDAPLSFGIGWSLLEHYMAHLPRDAITAFDPRSMEARNVEDAVCSQWKDAPLYRWRNDLLQRMSFDKSDILVARRAYCEAVAWQREHPHFASSDVHWMQEHLFMALGAFQSVQIEHADLIDPFDLLTRTGTAKFFSDIIQQNNTKLIKRLVENDGTLIRYLNNPEYAIKMLTKMSIRTGRTRYRPEAPKQADPKPRRDGNLVKQEAQAAPPKESTVESAVKFAFNKAKHSKTAMTTQELFDSLSVNHRNQLGSTSDMMHAHLVKAMDDQKQDPRGRKLGFVNGRYLMIADSSARGVPNWRIKPEGHNTPPTTHLVKPQTHGKGAGPIIRTSEGSSQLSSVGTVTPPSRAFAPAGQRHVSFKFDKGAGKGGKNQQYNNPYPRPAYEPAAVGHPWNVFAEAVKGGKAASAHSDSANCQEASTGSSSPPPCDPHDIDTVEGWITQGSRWRKVVKK